MTDRDKIRTEVKRRIAINTQCIGHSFDHADERIDELEGILSFIDSLQKEPVSVWHNMDEVPIKGEVIVVQTKDTFYGISVQKGGTTYKNKNKDGYVKWAYASDLLNLSNVQRTAKNWKEPVSEDLKKVYEKYVDHQIERIYPDLSPNLPRQSRMTLKVFDGTDIELAFEAGAKWQEEQSKK